MNVATVSNTSVRVAIALTIDISAEHDAVGVCMCVIRYGGKSRA